MTTKELVEEVLLRRLEVEYDYDGHAQVSDDSIRNAAEEIYDRFIDEKEVGEDDNDTENK